MQCSGIARRFVPQPQARIKTKRIITQTKQNEKINRGSVNTLEPIYATSPQTYDKCLVSGESASAQSINELILNS